MINGRYHPYREYKDSGIEWVGLVPTHWESKRLKYQVLLVTEKSTARVNPVGLENIVSWTGEFVSTVTEFQGEGVGFDVGDLLFGKLRPYLAKVYLSEFQGEAVGDFHVFRPKGVFGRYLQYLMLTMEFISIVDGSTYGAKMPRAGWEFMSNLEGPCPLIDEQKAIANFLDHETVKIDTLIDKQQQLIKLLKEKRQAVISHAVTNGLNPDAAMKDSGVEWLGEVPAHWITKRLKHISPKIGVGLVINPSTYTKDEGVYFIFGGDVKEYGFDLSKTRRISQADSNSLLPSRLNHRDLVCIRVGYPGITAVVHEQLEGSNCASVIVIRRGNYNSDWLCASMNMWVGRQQVELASYGAAQKQFNVADAIEFIFPVPPKQEQDEIANYVEQVLIRFNTLSEMAEKQIGLLQERRTALISAAVTGKIDVRNWQPEIVEYRMEASA